LDVVEFLVRGDTSFVLTASQIDDFRRHGYVVLPEAIEPESIASLRTAAADIVEQFDLESQRTVFTTRDRDSGRDNYFFASAEAVHCFLEEDALNAAGELCKPRHQAINKIGHALHDRIPACTQFCRQSLFSQLVRAIGYRRPTLWQTMYIFKQPQIGGEVRWHQDASYLITEPPAVTGLWVALEDAHRENGCLWVQPGGHRSPLRERYEVDWHTRQAQLKTLDNTPWPTSEQAVALEVPAGSVVVFHDHLPHYSARNTSRHSRHAFTMHVSEVDANWSSRNWLQRPTLGHFSL